MSYYEKILITALVAVSFVIWLGECKAGDVRVGSMPVSKHFTNKENGEYNETHHGVVVEVRISDKHWAGVMQYENSNFDDSTAAYLASDSDIYDGKYFNLGYMVGVVSGYDSIVKPMPFVLPTLTIQAGDHLLMRGVLFVTGVGAQFMLEF